MTGSKRMQREHDRGLKVIDLRVSAEAREAIRRIAKRRGIGIATIMRLALSALFVAEGEDPEEAKA